MKDIVKAITESKYDTEATFPSWCDFIAIDIESETLEFYKVADIKDEKIKKLKLGESYKDVQNELIWVCITDLEALNEK